VTELKTLGFSRGRPKKFNFSRLSRADGRKRP
jgi:hypothetical protein